MLRSRWLLPCSLALALTSACTGTPPESDGAAQPPPTDQPADSDAIDQAEDPAEDPAEPGPTPPVEAKAEPPADPWGPITDAQRDILRAGAEEARIKTPIHYVKTNERRHDVWFPYLENKRGIYVGVAADQNYTLIGVAKSEFVFLMDLDWRVTELHRAYEILIEASEDPSTLHQRFHADNEAASVALIEQALADQLSPDDLRQHINSWRGARETVYRHLDNVITRDHDGVASSWLSNPDYYAHIRKLYQNDRVRMLVGDLTGPTTLTTIAAAAKGLGLPVEVLYLSNAEEYYDYTKQYQANITGLPIAADSIVLRTIYSKDWVHADALWNYQVQPIADYQARIVDPKHTRRNRMLNGADKDGVIERDADGVSGLSRINFASLTTPTESDTEAAP
jgi:hypothetical protein